MPARKPVDLQSRHATKAEKAQRKDADAAMRSTQEVPLTIPEQLKGNKIAKSTWHRLVKEYNRLEAKIISRLDIDLLIDYCIEIAQLSEIDQMRTTARELQGAFEKQRLELIEEGDNVAAMVLAGKVAELFETVLKLDGRADRKRDLLLKIRQSLYMTPRARTGTAPSGRKPDEPVDEFEIALRQATGRVNDRTGDVQ